MSVSVLSERRSLVGEGPFWVASQKKLLHVDVDGNAVCRLDPETKKTEILTFEKNTSFVIPYENNPNKFLISVGQEIKTLEEWSNKSACHLVATTANKGETSTRLNDGKCDAVGRLWTGTMALETAPAVLEPEKGALYSLGKGQDLTKHVEKVSISNGMAWTSDNNIMFYVDSYVRRVYAFDFDLQNGAVSNKRIVVDFNQTPKFINYGYPDGMAIDVTNQIWLACYDAGQIIKIDPITGDQLQTIKFPATKITSCCFGGVNNNDLYVTSAYNHLTTDELKNQPEAGAVFLVKGLDAKGTEANSFCL